MTSHLLHADFYRVNMDRRIKVTVPVVIKGEPRGVKLEGGVLDFVHREIELESLPAEIPNSIEVDVSNLGLNDAIHLRDVVGRREWTPVSDVDMMLVHVIMPRAVEEPVAAERSGRGGRAGGGGRARSHQEGQDREGRRRQEGKEGQEVDVKLLVGLGNPGPQYRDTRHNVGFWVIDEIARRWQVSDGWRERDDALFVKRAGGDGLLKPLTFMNLSGFAVSRIRQFFQIEPADILVIVDEVGAAAGAVAGAARWQRRRAQRDCDR